VFAAVRDELSRVVVVVDSLSVVVDSLEVVVLWKLARQVDVYSKSSTYLEVLLDVLVDDMVPLVVREPELVVVEVELDDVVLVDDAV
jgi:hypothetical protein